MDDQQHSQDSASLAPAAQRDDSYDDHEVGYEAAMPALQGGLATSGAHWSADL